MDKDELIEMLNRHTYGQEEKKMDNDPRWITDRNPDKPGKYLTTALWKGKYIVTVDQFDDNGQWFLGEELIAWRPLPPPYIPPKEPAEKKCENCNRFKTGYCMMLDEKDESRIFVSSNNPDFTCGLWQQKK